MSEKRELKMAAAETDEDEEEPPVKIQKTDSSFSGSSSSSSSTSSSSSDSSSSYSSSSSSSSSNSSSSSSTSGSVSGDDVSWSFDAGDPDFGEVSGSVGVGIGGGCHNGELNTPDIDLSVLSGVDAEMIADAAERNVIEGHEQDPRSTSPLSTLVRSLDDHFAPMSRPETQPPPPPPPPLPPAEPLEIAEPPKPPLEEPPSEQDQSPEPKSCKRKGIFTPQQEGEEGEEDEEDIEDELFDMIETDVQKEHPGIGNQQQQQQQPIPHFVKSKSFLVERGKNHFDVLPQGWIKIRHHSGMPIYLHKQTRVVSVTRPYSLGSRNARYHAIPLGSVPCLNYKRAMEEEEKAMKEAADEKGQGEEERPKQSFPKAHISVLSETKKMKSVNAEEFKTYCKKLFEIKEVKMKKFKTWKDQRMFRRQQMEKRNREKIEKAKKAAPTPAEKSSLPDGLKLITIPVIEMQKHDEKMKDTPFNWKVTKKTKKDWVLNPKGKSSVCILHEYLQQSIKKPPEYKYVETSSSATPYSATVYIDGVEYGKGVGSSKRQAKSESARLTLEILIPDFKTTIGNEIAGRNLNTLNDLPDVSFFDSLRIEDPRVADLCRKVGEPSPYAILITCLQRNFGQGDDSNIETTLTPKRNKRNEFTMKVNNREVSVICKNKRDGKQLASQKLLQLLHPQLKSWSSLLRMYGSRVISAQKLKKEKESEVTALQSKHSGHPTPSLAILDKLRAEMKKLAEEKRNATSLVGKLTLQRNARDLQQVTDKDTKNA